MLTGARQAALAAIVALAGACATMPSGPAPSPSPTPNVALSKAADLRTHLDLLLAEHVMIVAKESAAAVNHADEYAAYAALLHANAGDLSTLFSRAFGPTSAEQLRDLWDQQNGMLVDYAIGRATHDDAKSTQAASALTTTFVPAYAQLLASDGGASADTTSGLLAQQTVMDRAFIDDYAAMKFAQFYVDLEQAYAHVTRLGDELATGIVRLYADKFPGDPNAGAVDARVHLNLLLQQDAYLATMASSSKVAGRTSETAGAQTAQAASARALDAAFAAAKGVDAAGQFANLWSMRSAALARYAAGDRSAAAALTTTLSAQLATLTRAPQTSLTDQAAATLKVIDDQLARSADVVAGDDRAAATGMQPIADAIVG